MSMRRPTIRAAFLAERGGLVLSLPIADPQAPYPGLEDLFPAAARMQRARGRPLRTAFHRSGYAPVAAPRGVAAKLSATDRSATAASQTAEPVIDAYEFVRVEGEGVHEIAVGPVHAGTIEPGHFRFSVVGEKVLRLEERLGYVHKGIERRFTQLPILEGAPPGRARIGGFGRRVLLGVLPGARGHRGRGDSAARRVAARAVPRARTRRQSPR